jgi:hypothetical protein
MGSPTGLVGGGGQGIVGGVELSLAAPVRFVVGLGGQRIDQIVELDVGQYEVKRVVIGADREDRSLTVIVEKRQGSEDCRGLGVDDDVAVRLSCSQLLATQVVDRSCPVADGAVISAVTAAPADGLIRLGTGHADAAGAPAVCWSARARQSGLPDGVGVPGAGCGDDADEVLGELSCRPGGVGVQVQEVLQIGDQHDVVTVTAGGSDDPRQVEAGSVVALRRVRACASR